MTNATDSICRTARGGLWAVPRKLLLAAFAAAALLINAIPGDAAFIPLPDSQPVPLSQLGDGLIVGDKVFTNFQVFGFGFGGAIAPDLSFFLVQGGHDDVTGDWGLHFFTAMNAGSGQTTNANLTFQVGILPEALRLGWRIKDVALVLSGASATSTGVVNLSETVFDGPSVLTDNILASLSASKQFNSPLGELKDSAVFAPQTAVWVRKDLSVTGGTGELGAGHLSEFFQFYSQVIVPEPASMAMMSTGGVALMLGMWVKRRKSNQISVSRNGKV